MHYVFFALISTKLKTFQRQCVEILCTEFHLNKSRNMESKAEVMCGLLSLSFRRLSQNLTLARQLLAKNSYIEFHEHIRTDGRTDGQFAREEAKR